MVLFCLWHPKNPPKTLPCVYFPFRDVGAFLNLSLTHITTHSGDTIHRCPCSCKRAYATCVYSNMHLSNKFESIILDTTHLTEQG